MDDDILFGELQAAGHVSDEEVTRWRDVAVLLTVFDAIGRDGAVAVLKVDGARPGAIYTVVVSGGRLGEAYFRKDSGELHEILKEAIGFYRSHIWDVDQ